MSAIRLPHSLRRRFAAHLARRSASAPDTWLDLAIFKIDRLGDFVLAVGALRTLLRPFPPERCVLIVSHIVAPLAVAEFPGVRLVLLPAGAGAVVREWWPLRRAHRAFFDNTGFRRLVCLRHARSAYAAFVLSWAKHETWHGLAAAPSGKFEFGPEIAWPPNYPAEPRAPLCRELLAHQRVVAAALGREIATAEILPRLTSVSATRGDYLLVAPCGTDAIREYPAEALAGALRAGADAVERIVFAGAPAQADRLRALAAIAGVAHAEIRTGGDPVEFARLVAGARAVLAIESAAAHLATALDKPAVILLGGGHHGMFGPWGEGRRQRWLTEPLPCFGCGWQCVFPEAYCLGQIAPERVAAALREALAEG